MSGTSEDQTFSIWDQTFSTMRLLYGEQLFVHEDDALSSLMCKPTFECLVSFKSYPLVVCREPLIFFVLIRLKTEFHFDYSLNCFEIDLCVTSNFFHGEFRISLVSILDKMAVPVFIVSSFQ